MPRLDAALNTVRKLRVSRQVTRTIYKMLYLEKGKEGTLGLRCGLEGVRLERESRIS